MKKTALIFIFLLFSAMGSHAAESMKTAIDIVEDFTREANILMKSRGLPTLSSAARDNAVEELKQIRLTEPPGKDRSKRVYTVVNAYTGYVMDTVRRSDGGVPEVAEVAGRLDATRADMLKALMAALASESVEKQAPKPVPSLDLSPHDEPTGPPDNDKGGILFR